MTTEMNTENPDLLNQIIHSALELKAQRTIQIDLTGKSSLTDFFVVCNGTSTAHNQGIADRIALDLKKSGILPLGMEGYEEASWILIDFNSVVVHIFLDSTRDLYKLEELYKDFPMVEHE